MPNPSRMLFRAALVIFIVTVVIGILNGTDLWDPPRNTLLTHVHAGTLGWITLGVFASAIWMFGGGDETRALATFSVVAISAYVLAFWSVDLTDTVSIQRPIGGTLAFVAMAWFLVWVFRAMKGKKHDVATYGMTLAVVFLVFGAVLGVLLGLQLADVGVVSPENANRLAESHPGAMVAGFVILAAMALIEWQIQPEPPALTASKAGMIQMSFLFLAGLLLVLGILLDVEPLLQISVPFQVIGTIILLVRHRSRLAPAAWREGVQARLVRIAVVGLIAVVALLAVLISQLASGVDFSEIVHIALAFDHINFLMVSTSVFFAIMATGYDVADRTNEVIFWGLLVGVAGFAVGLLSQQDVLKRIFTPILGLALLYGIYVYLTAAPSEQREPVSG